VELTWKNTSKKLILRKHRPSINRYIVAPLFIPMKTRELLMMFERENMFILVINSMLLTQKFRKTNISFRVDWRSNLQYIMRREYLKTDSCDFALSSENFMEEQISLTMPLNSPYIDVFNQGRFL
jgi:hypothetical protein